MATCLYAESDPHTGETHPTEGHLLTAPLPPEAAGWGCVECGDLGIEVWRITPHGRIDYWCPHCRRHQHHDR